MEMFHFGRDYLHAAAQHVKKWMGWMAQWGGYYFCKLTELLQYSETPHIRWLTLLA